ncbi:hypothetical protein Amsp01_000700 [Amycolatopsis sp. NBRC 101858]|uniref:hypothetical protein n=1 Tax=Amycolatopsis sp. NBRC 101858 TaxID=3032200 RepID=UPI0024A1FD60|nr:hypothetical protein [Amycolatopsis sp. NBRC 101858]GLY34046.1 hypothetical protein Amsp01_000700 [Amycolatopsis sp. NBRC 101858]
MAGSTAGGQQGERTAFATHLRAAIATSGLSLDRIQARLRARGVVVSVTALSYWQSGKRQPERQSSLSAVRTLEEILDVPAGSLLGLLPPPRPRGGAGKRQAGGEPLTFPLETLQPLLDKVGAPDALERQHPLKLVGLHDLCEIAADGGQRAVTARAVFQAGADGQDRWLLVYTQDDPAAGAPELHAVRNCRVGRAETDEAHGLIVAELIFDQPIDRGETHLIEYTLTNGGPPYPECRNTYYREFRRPVREYLLEVRFAPGTAPERCWQYARNGATGTRRQLKLDGGDGVHAVALDFGPGVFGIDWD